VLFRDGNTDEARKQYDSIAKGFEGRHEGLAALMGLALCHEADRNHREALKVLRRIEERAPKAAGEQTAALLNRARLHRFFCAAALNDFADAVQALAQLLASGGEVDDAWAWQFPAYVAQMANNRAYDEALAVLRAGLFAPEHQTLRALVASLGATGMDAALAPRARQLAEGFSNSGRFDRVREAYAAYPTEGMADAFARAVEHWAQRGQHDDAVATLAFCAREKLASPALSKATVELANAFCAAGAHTRVARLYEATHEPKLAPVFIRAIRETTDAGRLDDAFALTRDCLKSFPADARKLASGDGAAVRLAKAAIAKGDLLKPIAIHELFEPPPNDPAAVALFVEAANAAVAGKKPDAALRLLDHARARFGVLQPELAAAAGRLVALHVAAAAYDKAAAAYAAYPNETLAPAVAKAIAAAAAAGRPRDALLLLNAYARQRQALPPEAVRALADALAALKPDDDERGPLLDDYRRAYDLYDSPVARSTYALALGDAYVRAGRLAEALPHYEGAGDAEGALRAACLALETDDPDRAAALSQKLRKLAEADPARSAAAAFLLRETTPGDFRKAASAANLPAPLAHYLVGLRLWSEGGDGAAEEFAQVPAGASGWFVPLAARPRAPEAPRE